MAETTIGLIITGTFAVVVALINARGVKQTKRIERQAKETDERSQKIGKYRTKLELLENDRAKCQHECDTARRELTVAMATALQRSGLVNGDLNEYKAAYDVADDKLESFMNGYLSLKDELLKKIQITYPPDSPEE